MSTDAMRARIEQLHGFPAEFATAFDEITAAMRDGDPSAIADYGAYPLEVAAILAEMRLDDATIATALLHDTIEDTGVTRSEIDALFGAEIGSLVDGLTKIKKLDLVTKKAEHIAATGAATLLAGDLGCLMNMAGKLQRLGKPVRARHVAEVLAGIDEPAIGER